MDTFKWPDIRAQRAEERLTSNDSSPALENTFAGLSKEDEMPLAVRVGSLAAGLAETFGIPMKSNLGKADDAARKAARGRNAIPYVKDTTYRVTDRDGDNPRFVTESHVPDESEEYVGGPPRRY
jgi:hypothetical protein